jgi:hypothetical protein
MDNLPLLVKLGFGKGSRAQDTLIGTGRRARFASGRRLRHEFDHMARTDATLQRHAGDIWFDPGNFDPVINLRHRLDHAGHVYLQLRPHAEK